MSNFVDSVYSALIARGYTDATITPKLVFEAMRDETARLQQQHSISHQNFPSIFARDAADLARIEKAVGARLVSIDVGRGMVQSFWRELTHWWSPDLQNQTWLAQELHIALRSQGAAPTAPIVADELILMRDNLAFRGKTHPHLSAMTDADIRELTTRAFAHVRDSKRAALLLEVAANIESIWRFGTTLDQPIEQSPRLGWVASRIGEYRPESASPTHPSLALIAAARLDTEAVATYVQRGLTHRATLDRATLHGYGAEQRAAFFARLRDANNVLFTQSCIDLGARARAAAERPHASCPTVTASYATLETATFVMEAHNADTMKVFETARAATPGSIARVASCVMTAEDAKTDGLIGVKDFYIRLPVGEFGEPLAQALMQAVEIGRGEARALAAEIAADPQYATLGDMIAHTTLLQHLEKVLVEGIASIGQALALLLARKPAPPHDDIDTALRLIDEGRLVTQLAAMAPFGVLAPMANVGMVPGEPISVVRKDAGDRAQLPAGFEVVLHSVREARVEKLHKGDLHDWAVSDHQNETGRGCPVAGRGPVLGADGKVELAKDAGLSVLANHFIDLTRRLLQAPSLPSRPTHRG